MLFVELVLIRGPARWSCTSRTSQTSSCSGASSASIGFLRANWGPICSGGPPSAWPLRRLRDRTPPSIDRSGGRSRLLRGARGTRPTRVDHAAADLPRRRWTWRRSLTGWRDVSLASRRSTPTASTSSDSRAPPGLGPRTPPLAWGAVIVARLRDPPPRTTAVPAARATLGLLVLFAVGTFYPRSTLRRSIRWHEQATEHGPVQDVSVNRIPHQP